MTRIDAPTCPGWYAFRGYCHTTNRQIRHYAKIMAVEWQHFGSQLAAQTSPNTWRPITAFEGEWWAIPLPWEAQHGS